MGEPDKHADSEPLQPVNEQGESPRNLHSGDDHDVYHEPEPLGEDLYGVGITSFIRDMRKLITREGRLCLRLTRATVTMVLLWLTAVLQVFLMYEFKRLITQRFVHQMRWMYSDYQLFMYDRETTLTANGFHRGIPGHFDAERFGDMPEDSRKFICSFPLSQPYFCACVLMIWSLTVVIDLRQIQFHAELLLMRTDTIDSAQDMLEEREDHMAVLKGLTLPVKAMLTLLIFLPRLVIDLVLMWLGCRWLIATASFNELLLNAIALEFILLLKDLVYSAVVPKRNQWETSTLLIPHKRKTSASWTSYMAAFTWFLVVVVWVLLYIFVLQEVLPDYRWDVHGVCQKYIEEVTSLSADGVPED